MSLFEDQLDQRRKNDNEKFAEAMDSIAASIMGRRLAERSDSGEIVQSEIERILKYYHYQMKTDEIPPEYRTAEEQIEYRIRPFGLMRRTVELDEGWYRHAAGPMLGTLKESGRAVALIPGRLSGYSYFDAMTGKRVRLDRRTEKLLDREAVCFFRPLPLRSLRVKDLLLYMIEQFSASDAVLFVGTALAASLLGLLSPLFTKWLFGTVLRSGSIAVLMSLAVFMVCYSISDLCLSIFRGLVNARVYTKVDTAVQAAVMSRIINLPASFFKDYAAGELNQRAVYVQNLCSLLLNTIGTVGLSALFSLIYIGQIFAFAPSLVWPSLTITILTVLITLVSAFLQKKITQENMLLSSKTGGLTYATIIGMQKIKLAGAEKRMFSRWAESYARAAKLQYNPPLFLKLSGTISLTISLFGTLLLYYLAVKNNVSAADYYAFNTSFAVVSGAFMSFASIAASVAGIRPTLEMAKPIMEAEPERSEGKLNVDKLNGSIEMSNVSFRYEADMPNVIDGLSLKVSPGEYLAVVGSTGCGKSTLVRLLLGFERPQKGAIYYDHNDISKVDMRSLRSRIGAVMQDGKLLRGSIYSNIVITAPQLTQEDAWEAAEIASFADDIRAMPMGMNTVISEGQGGISGGQKQRLMIARAVASKPKILIFDEATSALDNLTQKRVSEAIDKLKCTRIVIAHRLSTIRHADRIIFLHQGRIVEDGTYEELIAKNGYFADLVERQRLNADVD